MSTAVTEFVQSLKDLRRSPWTVDGYQRDLKALEKLMPKDLVSSLTTEVLEHALRTWRTQPEPLAANTLFRRLNAIRSFCAWGRRRRLWLENPAETLQQVAKPDGVPRPFDRDEVVRLLGLELAPREDLMRAMLLYTGLRCGSICALSVGSVSFAPPQIRAVVKGGRIQYVELHPKLADKLEAHIATRLHPRATDPLFVTTQGNRLGQRRVNEWVARWGQEAGVGQCTPHRFRHTFGTEVLESTGDLRLTQEAMGHRSITSTQIYTRVRSARLRAAVVGLDYGETTQRTTARTTRREEGDPTDAGQPGENTAQ